MDNEEGTLQVNDRSPEAVARLRSLSGKTWGRSRHIASPSDTADNEIREPERQRQG